MRPIALVANPASGKDVRRITARASVFDNQEKTAMLRRALAGVRAMSDAPIRYLQDPHGLAQRALAELEMAGSALAMSVTGTAEDTTEAARLLQRESAAVVLVLGGDGTNRAFAKGWLDAPLIPLSTGTNNAFPRLGEATTAGAAAGLLAAGRVPLGAIAKQAKAIHVAVDGEAPDLALIDAVCTADRFVGSKALMDPAKLVAALLTQADPAGIGITSVGGFARPLPAIEDAALALRCTPDAPRSVLAAWAPGRFARVGIASAEVLPLGAAMTVQGPGVLAFDGERERTLQAGQQATLRVERDGPWVVDVRRTLACAAQAGIVADAARQHCLYSQATQ